VLGRGVGASPLAARQLGLGLLLRCREYHYIRSWRVLSAHEHTFSYLACLYCQCAVGCPSGTQVTLRACLVAGARGTWYFPRLRSWSYCRSFPRAPSSRSAFASRCEVDHDMRKVWLDGDLRVRVCAARMRGLCSCYSAAVIS
jgi:hypothetical protein